MLVKRFTLLKKPAAGADFFKPWKKFRFAILKTKKNLLFPTPPGLKSTNFKRLFLARNVLNTYLIVGYITVDLQKKPLFLAFFRATF